MYIYLKINTIDVKNIVAAVSTRHNCYIYELYVNPSMRRHHSRIRTFNGERGTLKPRVACVPHCPHVAQMGWNNGPLYATAMYIPSYGTYKKKRKRSIKSWARYHTLSVRFLRTRLQQKIVLPDADRAADSYYANREVIVVRVSNRQAGRRAISLPDSPGI